MTRGAGGGAAPGVLVARGRGAVRAIAAGEATTKRSKGPACNGFCRLSYARVMPAISSSTLANGLRLHRVRLPGTRAVTLLVAFDAGARTERPEENGMAHFLEHLVFKGGEKFDDYRKVNETSERMGGSLNAYTSHDLAAFHITVRAEAALAAA